MAKGNGEEKMPPLDSELPESMTDLEELMRSDEGEPIKAELLQRLQAMDNEMSKEMEEGAEPQIFERAKTIRKGLAAAYDIVVRFR